ncbi:MAG: alpha/beta hydrolase [Acidobacteria bacterium]|jgi:predicted esterase|nr:MAG: alpha/beta hydrolase [Acidobacteriota bacterium]
MFIFENTNPKVILIHLHGFASNVSGSKVELLRKKAKEGRFSFFAMDMEYHKSTTTETLEVLDALVKGFSQKFGEVWLSGSSHGGYVALNYLKFYRPETVTKVFLFAPSYSTLSLTVQEAGGEEGCKGWLEGKEELHIVECETGLELTINREFARDILERGYEILRGNEVDFPRDIPYELYLFHGKQDSVVPVDHSRLFCNEVKVKLCKELHDDHRLSKSFEELLRLYL